MTTVDFITELFYEVDEQLRTLPKHPEALWSAIIVSSHCEKVSSLRRQGCMTHTALDITPQSRHNKSH